MMTKIKRKSVMTFGDNLRIGRAEGTYSADRQPDIATECSCEILLGANEWGAARYVRYTESRTFWQNSHPSEEIRMRQSSFQSPRSSTP